MKAFNGINVMNVDPIEVYKDNRIKSLSESPVFDRVLTEAKNKNIKKDVEPPRSPENAIRKKMQLKKLRDASNELVSFLFFNMLKSMRATVPKDPYLDGGMAEEVFQEMVDHEYSKSWVQSGRIPLAQQIYDQLSKHIQ